MNVCWYKKTGNKEDIVGIIKKCEILYENGNKKKQIKGTRNVLKRMRTKIRKKNN
jgi:hypothetical protein